MNKIYKKVLLLTLATVLGGCNTTEQIDYFEIGIHGGGITSFFDGMSVALKGEKHQDLNISYQVYLGHLLGIVEQWENNGFLMPPGIYFQKKETNKFALKRIIEDSENKAVEVKYTVYNDFPNDEKYLYYTDGQFHGFDACEYIYEYSFEEKLDLSWFSSYLSKGKIIYKIVCYDVNTHEEVEMGLYDDSYYYYDENGEIQYYRDKKMHPKIAYIDFEINENKVLLQSEN